MLWNLLPERDRERPDLFDAERFELFERIVPRGPVLDPGRNFLPDLDRIRSFLVLRLADPVFNLLDVFFEVA